MKTLIYKTSTLFTILGFLIPNFNLYAAGETPYTNAGSVNGLSTFAGTVQGISQMMLQMKQQQQQLLMQSQALASNEDVVPAKYFPECEIAPAVMSINANACESTSMNSPESINEALMLANTAAAKVQFLKSMISPVRKGTDDNAYAKSNQGISCLNTKKSELLSNMQDRINSLGNTANQIKQTQEEFKVELEKQKENIKAINDELNGTSYGAQAGNTKENQAARLQRTFNSDPNCQAVLNSQAYSVGGIRGVRDYMRDANYSKGQDQSFLDSANNLLENQTTYRNQLNEFFQEMTTTGSNTSFANAVGQINSSNYLKGDLSDLKARIGQDVQDSFAKEYNAKYNAIVESFNALGINYALPSPAQEGIVAKLTNFPGGVQNYFEKQLIDECVQSESEIGFDINKLASQLKQQNVKTTGVGTSVGNYKTKLTSILNDKSLYIEDKVKKIKALDSSIGGNTIYIELRNGKEISKLSPGKAIEDAISVCKKKTTATTAYTSSSVTRNDKGQITGGVNVNYTPKEKATQGAKLVNDLLHLEKNAMSNLTNQLRNNYLDCTNVSNKGNGQCSDGRMNLTNTKFCLTSSVKCAQSTNLCYKKTENIIYQKEAQAKAFANNYNKMIEQYHETAKRYLGQIQTNVFQNMDLNKNYFENSIWKMPDDLYVAIDDPSRPAENSGLGEEILYGGGDYEKAFESFAGNITKLKESLEAQQTAIEQELAAYIEQERISLESNLAEWEALMDKCNGAADGASKAMQQAQAEQQQAQQQSQNEAQEFCNKYNAFNPAAGCNGTNSASKLYEQAMKVSGMINPDVISYLADFDAHCAKSQNEKSSKGGNNKKNSEKEKNDGLQQGLGDLCQQKSTWTGVLDYLKDDLFDNIPGSCKGGESSVSDLRDNVTSGSTDGLPKNCSGTWAKNFKTLASLYAMGKPLSNGGSTSSTQSVSGQSNTSSNTSSTTSNPQRLVTKAEEAMVKETNDHPDVCKTYMLHLYNAERQLKELKSLYSQNSQNPDLVKKYQTFFTTLQNADNVYQGKPSNNQTNPTTPKKKVSEVCTEINKNFTLPDLSNYDPSRLPTLLSTNATEQARGDLADLEKTLTYAQSFGTRADQDNANVAAASASRGTASPSSSGGGVSSSGSTGDYCKDLENSMKEGIANCDSKYANDPLKAKACKADYSDLQKVAETTQKSLDAKIKSFTKSNSSSTQKEDEEREEELSELGEQTKPTNCMSINTMSPSASMQGKATGISNPYGLGGSSSTGGIMGVSN